MISHEQERYEIELIKCKMPQASGNVRVRCSLFHVSLLVFLADYTESGTVRKPHSRPESIGWRRSRLRGTYTIRRTLYRVVQGSRARVTARLTTIARCQASRLEVPPIKCGGGDQSGGADWLPHSRPLSCPTWRAVSLERETVFAGVNALARRRPDWMLPVWRAVWLRSLDVIRKCLRDRKIYARWHPRSCWAHACTPGERRVPCTGVHSGAAGL